MVVNVQLDEVRLGMELYGAGGPGYVPLPDLTLVGCDVLGVVLTVAIAVV